MSVRVFDWLLRWHLGVVRHHFGQQNQIFAPNSAPNQIFAPNSAQKEGVGHSGPHVDFVPTAYVVGLENKQFLLSS